MMCDPIEKSRGHFCIAEDRHPFLEVQICGEDHGCALIQRADEMKDISKPFWAPPDLGTAKRTESLSQFIQNRRPS